MQKQTARTSEFNAALAQVASERGLDPAVVMETIKQAILAAFKKDHPDQYMKKENMMLHSILSLVKPIFMRLKARKKLISLPRALAVLQLRLPSK